MLARNVLIMCENTDGSYFSYLGKINNVKNNLFNVRGDNRWYNLKNIIKFSETFEDNVCKNCGKKCTGNMCNGTMCYSETEYKVYKLIKISQCGTLVKVKWEINGEITWEPIENIKDDVPEMFKTFVDKTGNPGNGFTYSPRNHEMHRDLRLREDRHQLRENLWSHEIEPTENVYTTYNNMLCTVEGKWLPKSKFSDRRLKWVNRGKRYNLHPH